MKQQLSTIRRHAIAIALFAASVISGLPAHGSWIAPQRELSSQELLEFAISEADAVGIGVLTATRDTIVDVGPDGSGINTRSVVIRVGRWLKGTCRDSVVIAGVSPFNENPLPRGYGFHPSVLFMLRGTTEKGWGLGDYPGTGLRLLPPDAEAFEANVRQAIRSQEPDSLMARADLVVIGRFMSTKPCTSSRDQVHYVARKSAMCTAIRVERVLLGDPQPTHQIDVFYPWTALITENRALFVLRRTPHGDFEPIGFQVGCQPIIDGRTKDWGLAVEEVEAKLRSR